MTCMSVEHSFDAHRKNDNRSSTLYGEHEENVKQQLWMCNLAADRFYYAIETISRR